MESQKEIGFVEIFCSGFEWCTIFKSIYRHSYEIPGKKKRLEMVGISVALVVTFITSVYFSLFWVWLGGS